jgi:hypothetical protein
MPSASDAGHVATRSPRLAQRAGVLTPAVALADRLRAAGMTLAVERRS